MALMKMRKHWNLHKISLRSQKMRKDNTWRHCFSMALSIENQSPGCY
jgi:hypothetical protein